MIPHHGGLCEVIFFSKRYPSKSIKKNTPIDNNVCCGFLEYSLYYVVVGSLNANFLEVFVCLFLSHKWVFNFVESFLCICWDDHMVFIFQIVNMMYHMGWFEHIEESLHPWDKLYIVIVYDHFNVLLVCLLRFYWGFGFWYPDDGGLVEWFWKCSFFCNFLEEIEWDSSSLNFW